jgi:glutamate/tyrosine decarboxylase-like PLP-dependent enzyme
MTGYPDPKRQPAALERAAKHALDFLATLDSAPVQPTATIEELRRRFCTPLPARGEDPVAVIDALVAAARDGILHTAGGRFYGWVIGAGLPASLGADWLTGTWDQNAGLYACGPAAAVVEEACGAWLKELLGVPAGASFALTTGCQMAHTTGLAAARYALLSRRGWDLNAKGLAGGPRLRILTSEAVHGTSVRSAKLLGIGSENVTIIPAAADYRLTPEALTAALAQEPDRPTIVILQGGDVNCGVFDPFETLIPIAKGAGAWVHIDGAMGLWAHASPKHRYLLAGADQADSWASDGHKWLNVPYDSGYAFVADPVVHRAALEHKASYLVYDDAARDQLDYTLEHSRRARGFSTWAALRELGRDGVAELVERCIRHADGIVRGIGALPNAEAVAHPIINQGLLRFKDPRPGATEADHDRRTDEVAAAINATGEAYFTNTTWRGMRCMRVSVSSWRTTEGDVARAVAAAKKVLAALPA